MSVSGSSFSATIRRGLGGLSWYVRGVMGGDAYEKYLDHHFSSHDALEHPPMTEREFWRDRDDRQDREPQGRCC
ncbi:uncharacterized protein DUF466 [Homoserinimonas aerilata]|uniref:Uncharacterized protein DUF466 n=1 Tax=Homoserinimonas aerilata TaxID=1162970 RepID=A0A542YJB5_9MICO|nr:YbdD/YjiX family protein [Homoserinimonas aerilata]TQL48188.1 uncharacterized protein DUF466 [Homoserinimonas aerilata]